MEFAPAPPPLQGVAAFFDHESYFVVEDSDAALTPRCDGS
jgi:hypothetical protein